MAVIDLVEITKLQKSQSNGLLDWLFFFLDRVYADCFIFAL